MSHEASVKLISPSGVLKQVAAAIPEDFRQNIIIVGSLAAGYYFFADNPELQVRTKDVDCLLSPRIQAIPAGQAVADRLFAEKWQLRAEGGWGKPGDAKTPDNQLSVVRLHPVRPKNSAETRWRIEPQGLLKDSPLCDDSTPIPAHRGRRLDEPTPTGCH